MSAGLVAFIWARLYEDERTARAADSSVWPSREVQIELDDPVHHAWRGTQLSPTMAAHIVRHGPKRVLAEIDAKRRIVAVHQPETFNAKGPDGEDRKGVGCPSCLAEDAPCPTLRLLALPYADHSAYCEEWRL